MSDQVVCRACGSANPVRAIYCQECNTNLRDLAGSQDQNIHVSAKDDGRVPSLQSRQAYFGRNAQLFLRVAENDSDILCDMSPTLTLGRRNKEDSPPHLDLSDYGAAEGGVSRKHARITRLNATIMIEDLGATNGTFVNDERLQHMKPYVLCDGDVIRLGNFELEVMFGQST
jgi:pSer/pThr/pTyr-binding forkhead associated (FHA) protein